MANSLQTKQALASSLKDLLKTTSFEKISISQICHGCNLNRKSFYYHFIDKYDLVNWIFDYEYISSLTDDIYADHLKFLHSLSQYIYANKFFYQKVFKMTGQNSFPDHFKEVLCPIINLHFNQTQGIKPLDDFSIHMLSELLVCAYSHWLSESNPSSPDKFVSLIEVFSNTVFVYLSHQNLKN